MVVVVVLSGRRGDAARLRVDGLLEGCWFTLAAMEAAPAGAVQPGDLSRVEVMLKRAGARLFDQHTAPLAAAQSKPAQRCGSGRVQFPTS